MLFKFLLMTLTLAFFTACSGSNAVDIKEGKWSIETTTVVPGMPFSMPPMTITQCMKKDSYLIESNSDGDSSCKVVNKKIKGSTVTWDVQCAETITHASMTYNHDTLNGEMKVEAKTEDGGVTVTSTIKGHYIGKCD